MTKDALSVVANEPSTTPATELTWIDISDESYRTYIYSNGYELRIDKPTELNIKRGVERQFGSPDSHRLRREGELTNVYVAPGWIAIKWDGDYQF